MHNMLTLRGALVRDPRVWAHYLDEAIELFGADTDVLFAGHHWPRWGSERIVDYLAEAARPLRLPARPDPAADQPGPAPGARSPRTIELPPSLGAEWHCRGYYGSVSHNVKAVYQRYMGWFDGNPAHLWEHPPVESARRYVEFMGGAEAVLRARREPPSRPGDYRWVAEVVNHVVFAEPEQRRGARAAGRRARAARLRRRERDLAQLLPDGRARSCARAIAGTPTDAAAPDILAQLSVEQILDAMAIRLDGPRAWDDRG